MNNEIKLIVVTLSLVVAIVMVDLTPIGAAPSDTMVEDFNIPNSASTMVSSHLFKKVAVPGICVS